MSESSKFDVAVIGNGPGGDNLARPLAAAGKKVAVVEKDRLGGECLNWGCVPSKALIEFGRRHGSSVPWPQVAAHVAGIQANVRGDDPDGGMPEAGITLIRGEATFVDANTLDVEGRQVVAETIVVATGANASLPPIDGLAGARPITNREIFTLPEFPRRLAVVGGGVVGVELGQAFAMLGAEVTLLEAAPAILGTEDADIAAAVAEHLRAGGIDVRESANITNVRRRDDGVVELTIDGMAEPFDELLVAAGRKPVIPGGLLDLGVRLTERGVVETDPCGKTSVPGIYAIGDVAEGPPFTHRASYQAHHLKNLLMGEECHARHPVIPWAVFSTPEVGHVGMTEAEARDQGDVKVARLDANQIDWFRSADRVTGFAKVIADAGTGRLLGAHFFAANAASILGEATLAVEHGFTARQVAETVHAYPTPPELFRWACARLV